MKNIFLIGFLIFEVQIFGADLNLISESEIEKNSFVNQSFEDIGKLFLFSQNDGFQIFPDQNLDPNIYDVFLKNTIKFLGFSNVKKDHIDHLKLLLSKKNEQSSLILFIYLLKYQGVKSTIRSSYEKLYLDHLENFGPVADLFLSSDAADLPMMIETVCTIFDHKAHTQRLGEKILLNFPEFSKKLEEALPPYFLVPVLGKGFFEYRELVENLINRRFLVAFPNLGEELSAHGVDHMSPLGFSLHDIMHIRLDHRKSNLMGYADNLMTVLTERLLPEDEILPLVIEKVVNFDRLFTETFTRILRTIDNNYIDKQNFEYKKIIYGFYLIMHETPDLYKKLFDKKTFKEFLESIYPDELLNLNPDLFNGLGSDYDNGECLLSDRDIFRNYIRIMNAKNDFKMREEDINMDLSKIVQKTAISIDMTIVFDDFKWENSLINKENMIVAPSLKQHYGDFVLHHVKPFQDLDPSFEFKKAENNEEAISQIIVFRQKEKECYDFFQKIILTYADFYPIREYYEKSIVNIETDFENKIDKIKINFSLLRKSREYNQRLEREFNQTRNKLISQYKTNWNLSQQIHKLKAQIEILTKTV